MNKRYYVIFGLILVFLFYGAIYRFLFRYELKSERSSFTVKNQVLESSITSNYPGTGNIKAIIKDALEITANRLEFSVHAQEIDPNILVNTGISHCVGYATFFSAVCNHLLSLNNLSQEWIAKPKTAEIFFLGQNVHDYLSSPFFKNHDVVVIENKKTGEIYAVDPTAFDYLRIHMVSLK